jgi:hypothetical protein
MDAALAVFSPDGKTLLYGSYFGGSERDPGRHIGINPNNGTVYIIGETKSTDIPLVNPLQKKSSGAFLATFTSVQDIMRTYTPKPSVSKH